MPNENMEAMGMVTTITLRNRNLNNILTVFSAKKWILDVFEAFEVWNGDYRAFRTHSDELEALKHSKTVFEILKFPTL